MLILILDSVFIQHIVNLWEVSLLLFLSLHSVTLLEIQWGPSRGLQDVCQHKHRALLQRSSHRVEEIKAKRALGKIQSDIQAPSEARKQSKAKDCHPPVTCKAKSEPQHKTNAKSKGGRAEQHQTTVKSGLIKQKTAQLPAPGISTTFV